MTWRNLTLLAVVPARGGSKGIPGKNLRTVGGRSLVSRAAQIATAISGVDCAVLTTDDAAIAAEGRRHGLDVPFMRPPELATDEATSAETWRHAWLASEAHYGRRFDLSVLLQPTTPSRTVADVERTIEAMLDGDHMAAATVSRVPGHFVPEKILTLDADHRLRFHHPDGAAHAARQTVPAYYYRNGICYAARRDTLVDRGQILAEDCAGVVVDRYVVNIDDPIELEIANLLASRPDLSDRAG